LLFFEDVGSSPKIEEGQEIKAEHIMEVQTPIDRQQGPYQKHSFQARKWVILAWDNIKRYFQAQKRLFQAWKAVILWR